MKKIYLFLLLALVSVLFKSSSMNLVITESTKMYNPTSLTLLCFRKVLSFFEDTNKILQYRHLFENISEGSIIWMTPENIIVSEHSTSNVRTFSKHNYQQVNYYRFLIAFNFLTLDKNSKSYSELQKIGFDWFGCAFLNHLKNEIKYDSPKNNSSLWSFNKNWGCEIPQNHKQLLLVWLQKFLFVTKAFRQTLYMKSITKTIDILYPLKSSLFSKNEQRTKRDDLYEQEEHKNFSRLLQIIFDGLPEAIIVQARQMIAAHYN